MRWGFAFVFLLIQWLFMPYRSWKKLFTRRYELDFNYIAIIEHGGTFLEYRVF